MDEGIITEDDSYRGRNRPDSDDECNDNNNSNVIINDDVDDDIDEVNVNNNDDVDVDVGEVNDNDNDDVDINNNDVIENDVAEVDDVVDRKESKDDENDDDDDVIFVGMRRTELDLDDDGVDGDVDDDEGGCVSDEEYSGEYNGWSAADWSGRRVRELARSIIRNNSAAGSSRLNLFAKELCNLAYKDREFYNYLSRILALRPKYFFSRCPDVDLHRVLMWVDKETPEGVVLTNGKLIPDFQFRRRSNRRRSKRY